MQTHSFDLVLLTQGMALRRSVGFISQNRVTKGRKMETDLMRAARLRSAFHKGYQIFRLENEISRPRLTALARAKYRHFHLLHKTSADRRINDRLRYFWHTRNERQIDLLNGALRKLFLVKDMGLRILCDEQTPRRVLIETMHKNTLRREEDCASLEEKGNSIEDRRLSRRHPGPRMDRDTRRLIDDQTRIVFVEDCEMQIAGFYGRLLRDRSCVGIERHAVTALQSQTGFGDMFSIHGDIAMVDLLLNAGARKTRILRCDKRIKAAGNGDGPIHNPTVLYLMCHPELVEG